MNVANTQTIAIIIKNPRSVVIAATIRDSKEIAHNIPSMCRFILRTSSLHGAYAAERPCLPLERLYN